MFSLLLNVRTIAEQLKINEFYGELSPQNKYNIVSSGADKILMIGDGLNDQQLSVLHIVLTRFF